MKEFTKEEDELLRRLAKKYSPSQLGDVIYFGENPKEGRKEIERRIKHSIIASLLALFCLSMAEFLKGEAHLFWTACFVLLFILILFGLRAEYKRIRWILSILAPYSQEEIDQSKKKEGAKNGSR